MTTILTFEEQSNLTSIFRSVLFTAFEGEGFGDVFLGLPIPLGYPDSHNPERVFREIIKQVSLLMISEIQEWDDLTDEEKSEDPGFQGMVARHEETMDALRSLSADKLIAAHRAAKKAYVACLDKDPALAFYDTEFNHRAAVKAAENAVIQTLNPS